MSFPFASVMLERAIDQSFDYSIPEPIRENVTVGSRVLVPLRSKSAFGYVIELKEKTPFKGVKPILESFDQDLTPPLFTLAKFLAKYYGTPLYKVLQTILPSAIRGKAKELKHFFVLLNPEKKEELLKEQTLRGAQKKIKELLLENEGGVFLSEAMEKLNISKSPFSTLCKMGFITIEQKRRDRSFLSDAEYFKSPKKTLTGEQKEAFEAIEESLGTFCPHLLHGVTGSGKTEVYLHAIDSCLERGESALMMVPEISLTTQTIERFKARFHHDLQVLHSKLSYGEKYDAWQKIKSGSCKLVIGARSSIFAPMQNLGLIIVDEEHDQSYKQSDEMPCYSARDVAVMRASIEGCPVILGSATPSLESLYNVERKKYRLHRLNSRPSEHQMPQIKLVDMQKENLKHGGFTLFSDPLLQAIKERLQQGEQTILFLNKRGYHRSLFCPSCKEMIHCSHCSFALTYHKEMEKMICHLCGDIQKVFTLCPKCKSGAPLAFRGSGTEQVHERLEKIFPGCRILRMDSDTTKRKGSHETLYKTFARGKADLLIGTQMIAKGLHFPMVTLVGILNCDSALNIPDYRASEQMFQLVTQVSGRAGRGALQGEVILQTLMPGHPLLKLAKEHDFDGFVKEELSTRKLFSFPPYTTLFKIVAKSEESNAAKALLATFREKLIGRLSSSFIIHPVTPAYVEKIKNVYRYELIVRGKEKGAFGSLFQTIKEEIHMGKKAKEVSLLLDVNP